MGFLTGYNLRQKITIDSDAHLSSDESDVTIAIHIPSSNTDFWASDDGDGTYVRFTEDDEETLLKFEVESYGSNDAWWHVKIPTLLSGANTVIYIYYDADSPSAGSDKHNTWDSDFKAVYHLNKDKAELAFDDSTSNNNDLTNHGTIDATGAIDRARSFDEIDDYLSASSSSTLNIADGESFTFEAIVNVTALPSGPRYSIVAKLDNSPFNGYHFDILSSGELVLWVYDGSNNYEKQSTETISTGADYHVGVVNVSDTEMRFYVNGVEDIQATGPLGTMVNDIDFTIGRWLNFGTNYFKDIMEEVTVSKTVRSEDWFKARNQSRLGAWLSFGAEEEVVTFQAAWARNSNQLIGVMQ